MKLLLLLLAKPMLTLSGATAFFWARPSSEFHAVEAQIGAEAGAVIAEAFEVDELLEAVPEDAVEVAPEPEAELDKAEVEKK